MTQTPRAPSRAGPDGRRTGARAAVAVPLGAAPGVGPPAAPLVGSVVPSVQAAGYYLALAQPTLHLAHASENLGRLVDRPVPALLGRAVEDVIGPRAAATLFEHLSERGTLQERNPLRLAVTTPTGPQPFDAILHEVRLRDGSRLLAVELEPADRPRSYAFPDTYRATRMALDAFGEAGSVAELLDVACAHVREITGFDRVFVRRVEDVAMTVVAEARRPDLSPMVGLRVLTDDFPPRYADGDGETLSVLADTATPVSPLVPGVEAGVPIDLTSAVLRPVDDAYAELLRATAVRSELAVALHLDGEPWGLLSCRHYTGVHVPPYEVRAAVELLVSTLALRLAAHAQEEEAAANAAGAAALARLVAGAVDESRALASTLLGSPGVLDVVAATGAVVHGDGTLRSQGRVPDDLTALRDRVLGAEHGVLVCASLRDEDPELADALPGVAGYLAIRGPDQRFVAWLRPPTPTDVWGDDLQTAALPRQGRTLEYQTLQRLYLRWADAVADRCEPWTERDVRAARELREHLFEVLLARAVNELRVAEVVQRSLLPHALPHVEGWSVDALYRPAAAGRVGGDWYDVLPLPGGLLALAVGDVGGHGLAASAAMGQLRNGLRAYLVAGDDAPTAVARLDALIQWTLPEDMATLVVAVLDPRDGTLTAVSAGHPPAVLVAPDGSATLAADPVDRPLGLGSGAPPATRHRIEPGGALVLYTDGLAESRAVPLSDGLERLRLACEGAARAGALRAEEVLRRSGAAAEPRDGAGAAQDVERAGGDDDLLDGPGDGTQDGVDDGVAEDDVTLLVVRRDPVAGHPDATGPARA